MPGAINFRLTEAFAINITEWLLTVSSEYKHMNWACLEEGRRRVKKSDLKSMQVMPLASWTEKSWSLKPTETRLTVGGIDELGRPKNRGLQGLKMISD